MGERAASSPTGFLGSLEGLIKALTAVVLALGGLIVAFRTLGVEPPRVCLPWACESPPRGAEIWTRLRFTDSDLYGKIEHSAGTAQSAVSIHDGTLVLLATGLESSGATAVGPALPSTNNYVGEVRIRFDQDAQVDMNWTVRGNTQPKGASYYLVQLRSTGQLSLLSMPEARTLYTTTLTSVLTRDITLSVVSHGDVLDLHADGTALKEGLRVGPVEPGPFNFDIHTNSQDGGSYRVLKLGIYQLPDSRR